MVMLLNNRFRLFNNRFRQLKNRFRLLNNRFRVFNKRAFIIAASITSLLLVGSASTQDDALEQDDVLLLAGVSFQHIEKESPPDENKAEPRVQIKERPKAQLIEGYKTGRNGQPSSYVHGEITEDKKGYISGYLYGKKGKKTYVYGQRSQHEETLLQSHNDANLKVKNHQVKGSEANAGEIVHDIESNEYLLNKQ